MSYRSRTRWYVFLAQTLSRAAFVLPGSALFKMLALVTPGRWRACFPPSAREAPGVREGVNFAARRSLV